MINLDKKIKLIKINNLEDFIRNEMEKRYQEEYKKSKFNPLKIFAKLQHKRLMNLTVSKITKDLEKGETFTFEEWKGDKKEYAILEKNKDGIFIQIYHKRF